MVLPAPRLAGPNRKGDALQRLQLNSVVRETHIAELNLSREPGHRRRVRSIANLAVGIESLEDTVGGCSGLLKIGVDATEFARRAVHHEEHGDERHELAGRQPARCNLLTAVPERQHESHATNEFHERRQQ